MPESTTRTINMGDSVMGTGEVHPEGTFVGRLETKGELG